MKLARFELEGRIQWGVVEDDKIFEVEGNLYDEFEKGKELCNLQDVKLLVPAEPRITVACGLNYLGHIEDLKMDIPKEPALFFKPINTLIPTGEDVYYPTISTDLRFEAELCCVIKRVTKYVSPEKALDHVLGYTCGNDLTLMDVLEKDGRLTRAKGFDTSGPLGPFLVTGIDPHNLNIKSWVNGELKQDGSTSEMIFNVPKLINYISQFMTLYPGDVVWTGTPKGGACPVKVGDVIVIEINGIGRLENRIQKSD